MARILKVAVLLLSVVAISVALGGCGAKGESEETSGETAESVRQTNAAIAELMYAAGELKVGVERFKVAGNGV